MRVRRGKFDVIQEAKTKAAGLTVGIGVLQATGTAKTKAELWSLAGSDRDLQKALDEDLCMEAPGEWTNNS